MTMMRAARNHLRDDGTVALAIDEVPIPSLSPGEVLVAVQVAGVNQIDLLTRRQLTPAPIEFPHIAGTEVAGVIAEVGADVRGWEPGNRVVVDPVFSCGACSQCLDGHSNLCPHGQILGVQTSGGYADYLAVPQSQLVRLDESISFSHAAAVAVTGPTAWHMLCRRAEVRVDDAVLVVAAGSGIGVLAVQIARLAGGRVVATAGSEEKLEACRRLKVDLAINHRDPGWSQPVRDWTNGRGVDVVFEHVGAATWSESLRALGRGGRLVTSGGHSGFEVPLDLWQLFAKEHTIMGSFAGSRTDLLTVLDLVRRGRITPVVEGAVPLEELPEAQRRLANREVFGKLLVQVGSTGKELRDQ
jgi:2-desacetyl-2-hydroxyethyl bacteriochlorophyllide A dehydrogenase